MKGGKRPPGYTIVEVMIVLAVSGVIFLIAIVFINGKEETASFKSGVNDMASDIQDVIEQVGDGQYSDISLPTCNPGYPPNFEDSIDLSQGTNDGCVFLGKFMYFPGNSSVNSFDTYSFAGNRLDPYTEGPAVTVIEASPTPIVGNGDGADGDLTTQTRVPENLIVSKVTVNLQNSDGTYTPSVFNGYGGFGFMQTLGSLDSTVGASDVYNSGGQSVQLFGYNASTLSSGMSETGLQAATAGTSTSQKLEVAQSASLCVTDGTRVALISIGSSDNNPLSVNVGNISLGKTCS